MKTFLAAPGIKFNFIDPDNSTLRETVPGNTYEPAVAHLLRSYVNPGDTVLDIGALYGYFGCFCGSISPSVKVYAFDPCPSYCQVIGLNAELNNLNNLIPVPLALSDTNSNWEFKEKTLIAGSRDTTNKVSVGMKSFPETKKNSAGSTHEKVSLLSWAGLTFSHLVKKLLSPPKPMAVRAMRYDDWARENQVKASLAKIDVHGAEVVVLRGMTSALKDHLQHLILEVHRIDMLVDGDYAEIINLLQASNFKLYELVDFRSDSKWAIKEMTNQDIQNFILPDKWTLKNKVEMRMIFATKGEVNATQRY